jgi:hypothetical protein
MVKHPLPARRSNTGARVGPPHIDTYHVFYYPCVPSSSFSYSRSSCAVLMCVAACGG